MKNGCRRLLPRVGALLLALVVLFAAQPSVAGSGPVVEHLRLKVPRQARAAWLEAERRSWEPWLLEQRGYLGRDLYWDEAREEGVLLIRWTSLADWKSIDDREVEQVQRRFESVALEALGRLGEEASLGGGVSANPFPLLHSGALEPLSLSRESHALAPSPRPSPG